PGSACSIAFGKNMSPMEPGSLKALQAVVEDIEATRAFLVGNGVEVTEIDDMPWGRFCFFKDPDGNAWSVQQMLDRGQRQG
ncbi:MAG TPA: VOC family protein, partial [Dermatophilaceae bacterium]|nr:VOC family protein [Dermatophilaceae bacterium]